MQSRRINLGLWPLALSLWLFLKSRFRKAERDPYRYVDHSGIRVFQSSHLKAGLGRWPLAVPALALALALRAIAAGPCRTILIRALRRSDYRRFGLFGAPESGDVAMLRLYVGTFAALGFLRSLMIHVS